MKQSWKTLAGLAVATAAALALTTSALALGSRPSSDSPRWRTVRGQVTWSGKLRALYPGAPADTELLHFTVTNTGHATQRLSSITVSMSTTPGGDVRNATGAGFPGCRAAWFKLSFDGRSGRLPVRIASGASYAGAADLAMRESGSNQNACRGAAPGVTITAG